MVIKSKKIIYNRGIILLSVMFFFSLLLIPQVSAFQWCEWIPFWTCSDTTTQNVISQAPKWIIDYSTDSDFFLWIDNPKVRKTEICLLSINATKLNDLPPHKNLYDINGDLIIQMNRKKKMDSQTGLDKTYYGYCRNIDNDQVNYIKFGEHSTVVKYVEDNLEIKNDTNDTIQDITLTYNTEQCLTDCEAHGTSVLYQDDELFDGYDFVNKDGSLVNLSNVEFYIGQVETFNNTVNTYDNNCTSIYNATNDSWSEECNPFINGTNIEYYDEIVYNPYNFEILSSGSYYWKIKAKKSPYENIDWAVSLQGFDTNTIRQYWAWWNSTWDYKKQISNLTGEYPTFNLSKETYGKTGFGDLRFLNLSENTELNYTFRIFGGEGTAYENLSFIDNIVDYYKLDEITGTVGTDELGNNDLTRNGGTIGLTGIINTAYNVSGDNHYLITSGNVGITGSSARSFSQWVKFTRYPDAGTNTRIFNYGGNSVNDGFGLMVAEDGSLSLWRTSVDYSTGYKIPLNEWTHIVETYDGSTARVYINGKLIYSVTQSWSTTDGQVYYGTNIGDVNYNKGDKLFDEILITNDALTDDEIAQLYNAQWVYVTVDSNNESSIYMYYGNDNVTTTENVNDTFLFPSSYYEFDLSTNDVANFRHTSSYTSSTGISQTTGYFSNGYNFSGGTDKLSLDNTYFTDTFWESGFTINLWINSNEINPSVERYVCYGGTSDWHISMQPGKSILNYYEDGVPNSIQSSSIVAGQWYMVTLTRTSGGLVELFLNGVSQGTYNGVSLNNLAEIPQIGNRNSLAWNGIIDEPIIYDRVLSSNEIQKLYSMSNQTDTLIFGSPLQEKTVKLQLIEPTNNSLINHSDIDFQCNCVATQDNCTQVNLTIDDIVVKTDGGTGSINLTSTQTVSDGNHNWTCLATNSTEIFNTSTYSFEVDTTIPLVNITSPTNNTVITEFNESFNLNWTITDANINECYYNSTENSNITFVNCLLNSTTVQFSTNNPDSETFYFFAEDLVNLTGTDNVTVLKNTVAPNLTFLFPISPYTITDFNETVNIFYNRTGNFSNSSTEECWYNTSTDSTNIFQNCSLGYFTYNFDTNNPDNVSLYGFINDSLGNQNSDTFIMIKNNESPNITIFEPFSTYDSIDIGELLNLNVSTTTNGVLDSCWYTYPNPWNGGLPVTSPLSSDLFDNNDSTYNLHSFYYEFYFNNSGGQNLTYRGGNCDVSSCSSFYNVSIDTSVCTEFSQYTINATNTAEFGCNRLLTLKCGNELLYTQSDSCLAEPHNSTVDLFPSNLISTSAFDNAIPYTCNTQQTFSYELGSDTIYVYANDTLENFKNQNRTWVSLFNIANETYEPEMLVSQTNDFRLDVITTASSILSPKLIYNGQEYSATLNTINSTNFYLTANIITYENMTGNNSFYWNITLDGTEYSSTPSNQTVSDINFQICNTTFNTTYFRLNFIDEETSSPLSSTIRTSSFTYYIDDLAAAKTYIYGVTTNSTLYEFCFEPNTETIDVDASISYYSNGYPERTTGFEDTFNNVSSNLTLSLLSFDAGIYPQITFVDSITKDGISGVSYTIKDGTVVAAFGTTGSSGSISPFLNPNIAYTVEYSKTGYGSYSDTETFTSSSREYIFEMNNEAFEVESELSNGLYTVIYPTIRNLDNNTIYDFGFYASEGDLTIDTMIYTVYDQNGTEIIKISSSGEGNMSQSSINTSNNDTFTLIAEVYGGNQSLNFSATFNINSFQIGKYSLTDWGLSYDTYFPVATRTTLTKLIAFLSWFILMLGAFTFGYNGSFKKKSDYTDNVSPQTRGNTSTGLLFAFLVTLLFSFFNLIPAPFVPSNGFLIFNNGVMQQNFFAVLMFIVLVWDLFVAPRRQK